MQTKLFSFISMDSARKFFNQTAEQIFLVTQAMDLRISSTGNWTKLPMLGNGPPLLGNGPHMLGNEPHVLGNGLHGLDIGRPTVC